MADLEALLTEFAAALEAGDSPDPNAWLARVDAGERQEMAAMIDSYLMTAPRRSWDPQAFESSPARDVVDRVYAAREGVSGSWPELLPQLRNRARVKRADLVRRLAEALGVGTGTAEVDRVAGYYNEMEHGLLPAEAVSGRVLEALASLVGTNAAELRAAGGRASEAEGGSAIAFARKAVADADDVVEVPFEVVDASVQSAASSPSSRALEEIDELFTGGERQR